MSQPTKQASRHVEAVLAALEILDCFQAKPRWSIKELVEETGQTRNRVMRLAGTLEYKGYLSYLEGQGQYALGPKVMFLGKVYEQNQSLIAHGRPILQRLVAETGESASLYVREGLIRVVLAREKGTQPLRFSVNEGQRMEMHAGAGSKVLLAYAPADVIEAVLAQAELERLTDTTITDPNALALELEKVRRLGFATSLAERVSDTGAIAAPVFDMEGRITASIGIAGPAGRIATLVKNQGEKTVVDAARELSRLLGWRGD